MSRVAEILLSQAQELKARKAAETRAATEELEQRLNAQAEVARAYYTAAATGEWLARAEAQEVAQAVRGVHEWADVDPERFAEPADRLRHEYARAFGVDLREVAADRSNP